MQLKKKKNLCEVLRNRGRRREKRKRNEEEERKQVRKALDPRKFVFMDIFYFSQY